jgi:hypothetical protein
MLTFKSTTTELVQLLVRDSDGSTRLARLQRDATNPRRWTGAVEHPSGTRWEVSTFSHDRVDAIDKLAHAFVSRESDYAASKGRNHRPAPTLRDPNVRVDQAGANIAAPVGKYAWGWRGRNEPT